MNCPNCAAENIPGAKFCNDCGTPLAAGCPNCGATNKPGAKFCNECGWSLAGGEAPRPTQAAVLQTGGPTAERRLVTVLFADIVGFTPFAEQLDAEDVRDTLSNYFELCAQIVERYGGTIEKYIGDAVMAVWGAPLAHEDDAERAVRAALELVESVSTLGEGVQARGGVLSGEAAVTVGATNQGLVAGDLVNTAARLQSVAPAGSVLVGESTMRASSNAIAYEPAGEQELKGKLAPVTAWRATRVVAERGGRNRSEQLEAPFVGRADELRLLKDLFHATGREQKVRLVSVIGPAGIGKSRLAWEFLKYVDGLVETTYWHDGRSPAYGEGISFWALGEMIRGRAGLLEGDDEATTRSKVSETVAQWVTDADERTWIERSLLALLGIEAGIAADELFAAWRTFFERISEQGTVTLVFEDLHFADSGLLDFIDHLLDWGRAHPIYIVTLSRPELLERRADWGAGKRSFTSLYLEPLATAEMRELLAGLVPGLPDSAAQAIVARADGIPLYAVETVRMLVADGRLVERDGGYQPVGELDSLAVPETLTALISSRLDSLEPADRSLIQDAAVLGQTFAMAAVGSVSGSPETELERRLRRLVKREMLSFQADPRSPERGQYAFVQALIREVAYNTLSKKERKARHLAAARYFESLVSDELAGALAGHYLAAYGNAGEPAEANALRAQSKIALRAAAERASSLGAYDQAGRFVEQAIEIAVDEIDLADLRLRAGEAYTHAASFDRAEAHLHVAIDLYGRTGDVTGAARATAELARTMLDGRKNQAALALLEETPSEFAAISDPETAVLLLRMRARALAQNELYARAVAVADEALDIAEHADLVFLIGELMLVKGMSLANLGRLQEGAALMHASEALARQHGFEILLANSLTVQTAALVDFEPQRAWDAAREALAIARRTGRRDSMLMAANNVGYTGFIVGDWVTAVAELDAALADERLDPGSRVWLTSNWVIVHVCRGDDVSAQLTTLSGLVNEANEPELTAASRDAWANAAFASGDLSAAAKEWRTVGSEYKAMAPWAYYQAARCAVWESDIESLHDDVTAFDAARVHGSMITARRMTMTAYTAALEGRSSEALHLFRQALEAWRQIGQVWDEALTGLDAVRTLDPADPAVADIGRRTREILARLEARPFLALLDAALAAEQPRANSSRRPIPSVEIEPATA